MALTKEQILDKVQKLLALATSPNEHEAALAAAKAQEILLQYKLTMVDVEGHITDDETVSKAFIPMGINRWRSHAWTDTLMRGVVNTTYCSYLIASKARSYWIIGRPTDVAVAKELYWWLKHQCERLALDAMKEYGRRDERFKTSFLVGCAGRVASRLYEAYNARMHAAGKTGTALVISSGREIVDYIEKEWGTNIKAAPVPHGPKDWSAYQKGHAAGDRVRLHKATGISKKDVPKLEG